MGAGRFYWGQLLSVLGAVVLAAACATQLTASWLGYQSPLGPPDAIVLGLALYAPWKFFIWWFEFDAYARPVFEAGGWVFLGGVAGAILLAFGFSLWRSREAKAADTYGTARWARPAEVKKLGLTKGDGVVLGSWRGQILRHDGDEHVLVVAPTNTGKSVGISLPTGLVWRHSFIALDLKGEAWKITSGLRSAFGPVYRFAPASKDTHRYNPLTQVRRGDAEVRDAQVLADMLVDPEGALKERSHWQLRAFELLVAVILWTLYAEANKTLARIAELLADPQRPVLGLLEEMLEQNIKDGAPHPVVASGARQLLDMADAERSGVVSTALGYLGLYRDPVLARATEVSDFSIEELICGERPVSIYLIIPPEEISRLKALLRLIVNQVLKRLTEIAAQKEMNGRRVLLMLDEFPQLGKLDFFEHALAYMRGYRIKACLIAQSLNQIAQAYGEHSSILDNAHVRVAFACNDERTAKRISDMLGLTTETRAQMNYAGSRMAPWLGHAMVSRQEVPRPLLTPGEVMQLPAEESLILTGGAPPIRARKIRYFDEPVFKARIRPPFASLRSSPDGIATSWSSVSLPAQHSPTQGPTQSPTPGPTQGPRPGKASSGSRRASARSSPDQTSSIGASSTGASSTGASPAQASFDFSLPAQVPGQLPAQGALDRAPEDGLGAALNTRMGATLTNPTSEPDIAERLHALSPQHLEKDFGAL